MNVIKLQTKITRGRDFTAYSFPSAIYRGHKIEKMGAYLYIYAIDNPRKCVWTCLTLDDARNFINSLYN